MTDGSEPNDIPKSESYKDDRLEESTSGPEGEQKGGNPNIEDETKNVEMNQGTSGVTKRPITTIATKEIVEENDVNEMAMNSNDEKLQNDKSNSVSSRTSKDTKIDTGDISTVKPTKVTPTTVTLTTVTPTVTPATVTPTTVTPMVTPTMVTPTVTPTTVKPTTVTPTTTTPTADFW